MTLLSTAISWYRVVDSKKLSEFKNEKNHKPFQEISGNVPSKCRMKGRVTVGANRGLIRGS